MAIIPEISSPQPPAPAGRPTGSGPQESPPAETAGTRPDRVNLSAPVNPYAGLARTTQTVRVDGWKQGPNGSVEQILINQGYSKDEIYQKDRTGKRLIERVAGANGLRDPNLVRAGQRLVVPVKPREPEAPHTGGTPSQQADARTARVIADPWKKGPNDSLERILQHQGYSLSEIYTRDKDGKRLLDRVAESNGLRSPDALRSGQELTVPEKRPDQRERPEPGSDRPDRPDPKPDKPHPSRGEAPKNLDPGPNPPAPKPEPADGEATLEMGLLLDGAREKRFTRDEFKALNSASNRYEELRAEYGRDGFSAEELQDLGNFEKNYGQMYNRFYEHDRSRIDLHVTQPADPRVQSRVRLTEEGGEIYDGLTSGQMSLDEAAGRLIRQRQQARNLARP
ncbi:MAG: LysM peptidoglycan-binding domain-containing protein [Candidatus Eremiobacterota bacterium]